MTFGKNNLLGYVSLFFACVLFSILNVFPGWKNSIYRPNQFLFVSLLVLFLIVTSLRKDTKVTVLTKNAGSANGYNWDKIVTSDGLEGYIANIYLRYEEEQENDKPAEENNSVKYEYDVDGSGTTNSSDLFFIIKFLKQGNIEYNKTYDINQDGKVNSSDLYQVIVYLKQC